eukprot:scaffold4779_cov315-Pinguiococcus_pyrenoidosus.AAC.1
MEAFFQVVSNAPTRYAQAEITCQDGPIVLVSEELVVLGNCLSNDDNSSTQSTSLLLTSL